MPNAEALVQQSYNIQQTLALERAQIEVAVGDGVGERRGGEAGAGATVYTQMRDLKGDKA